MIFANYLALIVTLIGGINWGLVGIFNFDLISFLCAGNRNGWAISLYVLVALATIWLIISSIISRGVINLGGKKQNLRKD